MIIWRAEAYIQEGRIGVYLPEGSVDPWELRKWMEMKVYREDPFYMNPY